MCSLWLIGILVYTTSPGNLGQVYGGKFVVGIGLGQMSVIAPAYCVEVSRPESRGKLPISLKPSSSKKRQALLVI